MSNLGPGWGLVGSRVGKSDFRRRGIDGPVGQDRGSRVGSRQAQHLVRRDMWRCLLAKNACQTNGSQFSLTYTTTDKGFVRSHERIQEQLPDPHLILPTHCPHRTAPKTRDSEVLPLPLRRRVSVTSGHVLLVSCCGRTPVRK